MLRSQLALLFALVSWNTSVRGATGSTTCKDDSLDWYTSKVGETPCKTYELLRQTCNSAYTVPEFEAITPPDVCADQVADCCCNSIAWSLSMLCLNCQQGVGTGNGIDAGAGAYQIFLSAGRADGAFCAPNKNNSLPDAVQTAVCNNNIKIPDTVYHNLWPTGDWFYIYSSQGMTKDLNAGNQFTTCPDTSSQSSSSSTTITSSAATSTAPSDSSDEDAGLSTGATAGIAVGASIVGLAALAGLIWFFLRRRKLNGRGRKGPIDGEWEHPSEEIINPYVMSDASVGMGAISIPPTQGAPSHGGGSEGHSEPQAGPSRGYGYGNASQAPTGIIPAGKYERYMRESDPAWNGSQDNTALHSGSSSSNPPGQSSYAPSSSGSGSGRGQGSSERTGGVPTRHVDAGPLIPLDENDSDRENDMELPPAYGEQTGAGSSTSSRH